MNYRLRNDCRLCGASTLDKVLELPATPLANEFPMHAGGEQEEFPLWLAACRGCGHVQLPVVVSPERLFRDYVYVSGTSPVFREHFRRYATEMIARLTLEPNDLVVEIGSNDGTMLKVFAGARMRVLGIDPAVAIARRASAEGVETWPEFFSDEVATRILARGRARLVVANNVFAHADDLAGIARAAKMLLEPNGAFVFEVSYLADVLRGTLFDTIYHEHLSFHAVEPLIGFFSRLGMSVLDARRVDTHGGSLRVTVSPKDGLALGLSAAALVAEERAMGLGREPHKLFTAFGDTIASRKTSLLALLREARAAGGTIAGYGAPAKATTLLRTFGAEEFLDFVVDDSPHKQHLWLPGGRIPVLPSSALVERHPSHLLILAWNFAESILDKLEPYRAAGGTCIVPLPTVRVLSHAHA